MYTFKQNLLRLSCPFKGEREDEEVKNEPMFFNSTVEFALENGGKITEDFLLPLLDKNYIELSDVFDSRVHMLMPGWYPCIPGWHHDDVPRSVKTGQPDYDNQRYFSKHIIGLVNADIAPTEFLLSDITLPKVEEGVVYGKWNDLINKTVDKRVMNLRSGEAYYFDCLTFHRGTPAVKNGWRWLGRVSYGTSRKHHITNEIRKQVQVYLPYPEAGW